MNCSETLERLDDFMDGELPPALAAEMERHIESCPACRAELEALRSLLSRAESLPRSLEPPKDLWPGIKARLGAEKAAARDRRIIPFPSVPNPAPLKRRRRALPYAAAAALVLGIAGSLSIPALARRSGGESFAYRARALPASLASEPGLSESQATFESARAELYASLKAREKSMSKETASVIAKNLRAIDAAVQEIQEALEKDPGNEGLSSFLFAAYENEIRVLSQAASLPGSI